MNVLVNTTTAFQCRAESTYNFLNKGNVFHGALNVTKRSLHSKVRIILTFGGENLALEVNSVCSIPFCKLLDRRIWEGHLTSLGLFSCLRNRIITFIRVDAGTKLDGNIKGLSQRLAETPFLFPKTSYRLSFSFPQGYIWSSELAHSL